MRCAGLNRALLLTVAVVLCGAGAARATEVIFSATGGSGIFQGGLVAGNSFTAASGFTVNSLGFIDLGNDGIAANYTVGLFDTNSQTLLASAIVTPSSPLINGFRYAGIPATILAPGQSFTIAASLPVSAPDPWLINTSLTLGPGFTGAGTGRFLGVGSLTFPINFDSNPYEVVNASDAIVPEPATTTTLAAAAVLCVGLLSRRRAIALH